MGHTTENAASSVIIFEESHPDDAFVLGPNLRLEDAEEMYISSAQDGRSNSEYLLECIESSGQCLSILDANRCMLGVWGHGPWCLNGSLPQGYVWLMGCDALFKTRARRLTRAAKDYFLPILDAMYPGGYGNLVKSTNSVHLRWLKAVGFKDIGAHYIRDTEFRLMWRKR